MTHVPHTSNNTLKALNTYVPPFSPGGFNRENITKWGKMGLHIAILRI
jgi:hypothetical protein